jgi:hypothetical protein
MLTSMVLVTALATLGGAAANDSLQYRFDDVSGKVTVEAADGSFRAEDDSVARAGDTVRTGWRGRAIVSVHERASRFEIYPRTRVKLTPDRPGVILLLEKGRLKAMFDAITGEDERIVETPGATLAVRGTRYGVEVDSQGNASLCVFEGVVEVIPHDTTMQSTLVHPGDVVGFGPHHAPKMIGRGMTERMWTEHGGTRSMSGESGGRTMMDGADQGTHGAGSGGARKPH